MEAVGQLAVATGVFTSGVPQVVLATTLITAVLGVEFPRRVAGIRVTDLGARQVAKSCATVIVRCAPELCALIMLLVFSLLLRLRGDHDHYANPVEQKVWDDIKAEWPILMGADTLLNLQAMLRLMLVFLLSIRSQANRRWSPLEGTPAALMLAAMVSRSMMNTKSDTYWLEGPLALGGALPNFCEFACIPLLAKLAWSAFRKSYIAVTMGMGLCIWFASKHFLNLARNPSVDRLFIQAHLLEMVASFFFLARTISLMFADPEENDQGGRTLMHKPSWRDMGLAGYAHKILLWQAALSAYYFMTAFPPDDRLVGSGRPFCVLCGANLLQLGVFAIAAVLWAGGAMDMELQPEATAQLPATPSQTSTANAPEKFGFSDAQFDESSTIPEPGLEEENPPGDDMVSSATQLVQDIE